MTFWETGPVAPAFRTAEQDDQAQREHWLRTGGSSGDNAGEAFADEFGLHTLVGQGVSNFMTGRMLRGEGMSFDPVDGYNAYDTDLTGYEAYLDEFLFARSPGDTASIKHRIDENNDARRRLDYSSNWAAKLSADLLDPVNLIPVPFAGGIGFAQRAVRTGQAGFAAFAPAEIARANIDPTNEPLEPVAAIAGATIVGGLLGGAFGNVAARRVEAMSDNLFRWGEHVEAKGRVDARHAGMSDTVARKAEGEPEEWVSRGDAETEEAYAARIDEIKADPEIRADYESVSEMFDPDRIMPTGIGAEKFKVLQHPWMYLKNTAFEGNLGNRIRRLADSISGSPGLYTVGNESMQATAQSVHIAAMRYNPVAVKAHAGIYDAFKMSLGIDPKGFENKPGARAVSSMKDSLPFVGNTDVRKKFYNDVTRYYLGGGDEALLEGASESYMNAVKAGANSFKEYMDLMGLEASRAGLFGIRTLENRMRKTEQRMLEADAEISRLEAAGVDATAPEYRRALDNRNKSADEYLDYEGQVEHLKGLNEKGVLPDAGDGSMGHFPRFWKQGEVLARRDELYRRLEDYYIKQGHVGERVNETIDRIIKEGNFGAIRRSLVTALEAAGRTADDVNRLVIEFDTLLGKSKDMDSRVKNLSPLVLRHMADNGLVLDGGREAAIAMAAIHRAISEIEGISRSGMTSNFGVATSALSRKMDIPSSLVMDFIETDPERIIRMYHRRMAPSIEMSKRFREPSMMDEIDRLRSDMAEAIEAAPDEAARMKLQKEADGVIESVEALRDKVLGVYKIPDDPSSLSNRTIMATKNYMVLALMGGSVIAGLADIGRVAMSLGLKRSLGGVWDRFSLGVSDFKLAAHEVEMSGQAAEIALHGRFQSMFDTENFFHGSTAVERFGQAGVERMFVINGLSAYTDILKRWSGAMIQSEMIRLSKRVADGEALTRTEKMWMSRAGIDEDLARAIHGNWLASYGGDAAAGKGNSLFLANTDAWTDSAVVGRFRSALAFEIDNAVITPGPSEKLNFMSTPVGGMVTQFKAFSLAATHRTTLAGLQARDARAFHGLISMIAMGYFVDYWKSPDYDKRPVVGIDRLLQAVDYSGAMGILFDINNTIEVASGHSLGVRPMAGIDALWKDQNIAQKLGQPGGPAVSLLGELAWSFTSPDAEHSDQARSVRRLIPFNNLIWYDGIVDKIQRNTADWLEE